MPNEDNEPSHCGPLQILLVEDHPQVRKLLRQLIETYDDLSVVGEAVNGEEAMLLAAKLKPAAVVMDVHLPVLSGVPTTTLIKMNNPFTAIIGLTAGGPHEDEKAMIAAGAAAVINKSDVIQMLHSAVVEAVKRVKSPVLAYDRVSGSSAPTGASLI
jgi:DNA-binding NarL/FixJ family response regulator